MSWTKGARRRKAETELLDRYGDVVASTVAALAASPDVESTLRVVARAAVELVGAEYAVAGTRDRGNEAAVHSSAGADGVVPDPIRTQLSSSVAVALIDAGDARTDGLPDVSRSRRIGDRPSLSIPIRLGAELLGVVHVAGAPGADVFTTDDELTLQAIAASAAVALENARLTDRVTVRQALIDATRDIAATVPSGGDAAELLPVITSRACSLVDADTAFLALPERPELPAADVVVAAASGADSERIVHIPLSIHGTSIGDAYRDDVPKRFDRFDTRNAVLVDHTGPALVLPLRAHDHIDGVLVVLRRNGSRPFTDDEFETMTKFADHAALALQAATAQRRMRELDVLTDRDRIARDLHDHAIQLIFAAGLSLQGSIARSTSAQVRERLSCAVDELQEVVQDIRSAIFGLQVGLQGPARLRERLDLVIAKAKSTSGVKTTLHVTGPLSVVDSHLAEHAEAVVREAIGNAVRDSWATTISVVVSVDDALTIEVTDNGGGPPITLTRNGLQNLEARAKDAGGALTVQSIPDAGVHLMWSAPLR